MKLIELAPQFLKRIDDRHFQYVDTLAEAHGILFLCPKCWVTNGGAVGTHAVICWNPSVPQTTQPTPGRWNLVGTGFDDLSLVAGSSSILLPGDGKGKNGCGWHGWIKEGNVL